MTAPIKVIGAPTPWPEETAEGNAEAKMNCSAHDKSGPRREVNDPRFICRHDHIRRVGGHYGYVGPIADGDLRIAAKISVLIGELALVLNRILHVLLLGEEGIAQLAGLGHVRSHHVEYRWKRQQRLHTGIPGQLVVVNRVGQVLSLKVMMLICPIRRVGNLVGIGCRR